MASEILVIQVTDFEKSVVQLFEQLYKQPSSADIILESDGGQEIRVHKFLLAARSPFFAALFDAVLQVQGAGCGKELPRVTLDVPHQDLSDIVRFLYTGVVEVDNVRLASLVKSAKRLQIAFISEITFGVEERGDVRSIPNELVKTVITEQEATMALSVLRTATSESDLLDSECVAISSDDEANRCRSSTPPSFSKWSLSSSIGPSDSPSPQSAAPGFDNYQIRVPQLKQEHIKIYQSRSALALPSAPSRCSFRGPRGRPRRSRGRLLRKRD